MRNPGVIVLLWFCGGCASTTWLSFGEEAEAAVRDALASSRWGEAALATGRATYWVPPAALASEREALAAALRAAEKHRAPGLEAGVTRDVEVVFRDGPGVTAWLRSEFFEAAVSGGTLRVERVEFSGEQVWYRLSVIRERHVMTGAARQGAAVDRAWRRLAEAAERATTRRITGYGTSDRPLDGLRDVGIDFRGLTR